MHKVDGFELEFTSRTSWKANRYVNRTLIDTVPVAWTKGFRHDKASKTTLAEVWYQNPADLQSMLARSEPFVIALAAAKDYEPTTIEFKEFRGVFEVQATGRSLSPISIETIVLRRLKAKD